MGPGTVDEHQVDTRILHVRQQQVDLLALGVGDPWCHGCGLRSQDGGEIDGASSWAGTRAAAASRPCTMRTTSRSSPRRRPTTSSGTSHSARARRARSRVVATSASRRRAVAASSNRCSVARLAIPAQRLSSSVGSPASHRATSSAVAAYSSREMVPSQGDWHRPRSLRTQVAWSWATRSRARALAHGRHVVDRVDQPLGPGTAAQGGGAQVGGPRRSRGGRHDRQPREGLGGQLDDALSRSGELRAPVVAGLGCRAMARTSRTLASTADDVTVPGHPLGVAHQVGDPASAVAPEVAAQPRAQVGRWCRRRAPRRRGRGRCRRRAGDASAQPVETLRNALSDVERV